MIKIYKNIDGNINDYHGYISDFRKKEHLFIKKSDIQNMMNLLDSENGKNYVNETIENGDTIFQVAVYINNENMIEKLLSFDNLSTLAKNNMGYTNAYTIKIFNYASKYYGIYPSVIDYFIKHGHSLYEFVFNNNIESIVSATFKVGTLNTLNSCIRDIKFTDVIAKNINMYTYNFANLVKGDVNLKYVDIFTSLLNIIPSNGLESGLESGLKSGLESRLESGLKSAFLKLCKIQPERYSLIAIEKKKADINYVDTDGYTGLLIAAKHRNYEVAKKLLECGCDPNVRSIYGETAMYYSISNKDKKMYDLLCSFNASTINIDPLHRSIDDLILRFGFFELNNKINLDKNDENPMYECSICFEFKEHKLYLVPCGHGPYCNICIKKIFDTTKECPYCKNKFDSTIKIFNVA